MLDHSSSPKFPTKTALTKLVSAVKKQAKEYGHEIQLTVGADGNGKDDWNYQTGDNSYTGGAYGYRNWAVVYVGVDEPIKDIVDDIIDQL